MSSRALAWIQLAELEVSFEQAAASDGDVVALGSDGSLDVVGQDLNSSSMVTPSDCMPPARADAMPRQVRKGRWRYPVLADRQLSTNGGRFSNVLTGKQLYVCKMKICSSFVILVILVNKRNTFKKLCYFC